MNKQEIITVVNKIDNIFKYSIKGGTSMFNKDYPNLLNEINLNTKEIEVFASNKKLVAKLIYLSKYNGEINNLSYNNNLMIYDYRINDFKISNINAAQKQWDEIKSNLITINELYGKEETIELLKYNYKEYFGKLGNRKLIKKNNKLFLSLYHHTSDLNLLNKNLNKFTMRLYILINNISIYCTEHNCLKFWKLKNNEFYITCNKCEPKYPSIDWFKKKYNEDWEKQYNNRLLTVKNNKTNSLEWFKIKYGEQLGVKYHADYILKKMTTISKLKGNKYSKISQTLFWSIYNKLNNKEDIHFFELNFEYVFKIPEKYNHKNTVMMFDFKQKNNIIEYNGNYWHSKENDNIRYEILKEQGFNILVITSDEYNRNKKPIEIINKFLKFLEC